jgi:S-adenosylmethionine decarboxylase
MVRQVSTKRKICVKKALKKPCTFGSIDLHRGNFLGIFKPPGGFRINCQPPSKRGARWMKREACATHDIVRPLNSDLRKKTWPEHHSLTQDGILDDHFVERDGVLFAGTHLILDFWGAKNLDDLERMESALRRCVDECEATLLHIHLHHFTPNGGISGVAVLAESHISVHTWPERDFAAFDIFMCGQTKPEEAISILKRAFTPRTMQITENLRGVVNHA